jgi:hypothetical protein
MKTYRFPKLAHWLAGIYLAWSLLVFFGSLGSQGHSWWPLFLYFIIWPISAIYNFVSAICFDWVFPKSPPEWAWLLFDYVSGAFYIIVGTVWIWFLGRVISRVVTRLSPIREPENEADKSPQETPP